MVGATIYNQKDPQNLSYVPVYSITDKDLSKRIQLKENKTLKEKQRIMYQKVGLY